MSFIQNAREYMYSRGHRPKKDSPFYSEKLELKHQYLDVAKREQAQLGILLFQQSNKILQDGWKPTGILNDDIPRSIVEKTYRTVYITNWDNEDHAELSLRAMYCVECGNLLKTVAHNQKECDWGHGLVSVTDSPEGLPVIVFNPSGMD